jgi:hypothetical protein
MPTNTRESGLESLIVDWLTQHNGFEQGVSADYNREYTVDEARLFRFLNDTQPTQTDPNPQVKVLQNAIKAVVARVLPCQVFTQWVNDHPILGV